MSAIPFGYAGVDLGQPAHLAGFEVDSVDEPVVDVNRYGASCNITGAFTYKYHVPLNQSYIWPGLTV